MCVCVSEVCALSKYRVHAPYGPPRATIPAHHQPSHHLLNLVICRLYEYVRMAIADPEINWVDLGASRRQAKTSIGFEGYPVSAYIRCKNVIMESIVETMAEQYFKPTDLIADP